MTNRTLDHEALQHFARKYIWSKSPEQAAATPGRVMAQMMDIGEWDDVQALAGAAGDDALHDVPRHAEAGQFRAR